jgi:uncharacterized BrkB/YihY/UPF0761 family membrane protein
VTQVQAGGPSRPVWRSLIHVLVDGQLHVMAIAAAGAVLAGFMPFLVLSVSVVVRGVQSDTASEALLRVVEDTFASGVYDFIRRSLLLPRIVDRRVVLLLLVSAYGVVVPLELALRRTSGAAPPGLNIVHRIRGVLLVLVSASFVLASACLTDVAAHTVEVSAVVPLSMGRWMAMLILRLTALGATIAAALAVYGLTPRRRMRDMARTAVLAGALAESLHYAAPPVVRLFDPTFERGYGVFYDAIAVFAWSYLAILIFLLTAAVAWAGDEHALAIDARH